MSTLRIALFLFLLAHAYESRAHVALDYPQGGETFIVGETILIQWHIVAPHNTLNWDLFFSVDGGETWDTLQMDIPTSQLSYEWVIPDSLTTQARIQVFQDNEEQNYLDNSMDFTIAPNTSPPTLDAPAMDTTIECSIANQQAAITAWLNNHGGAAATNYCSELVWSHDYPGISNECGATGSAEVTFTATDECGEITTNATLTIVDSSPPTISLPAIDMVVETSAQGNLPELNAWLNSHGGAQAADGCGQVLWTNNFAALSDDCGLTGSATVIFTATDQCGNSNTTAATFMFVDHTSPTMHAAAQLKTITCGAANHEIEIQQWLDNHGGAQASDVGSEVSWTNNYTGLIDGCGLTGSAMVIFTAADECGNHITTEATIAIEDHTAPIIQMEARNTLLECIGAELEGNIQHWLDGHAGAHATDECGDLTWINNYTSLSDGCGPTGFASVLFTVMDACGNSSTTEGALTIEDNTSPVIDIEAQDTTIMCGSIDQPTIIQSWLNRQGGASASDLCSSITWTNDFIPLADTCGPVGLHTITFTATDECGYMSMTQAILTIMDSLVTALPVVDDFDFKVYPNPASDVLFIAFDRDDLDQVQLTLFNVYGKELWVDVSTAKESIIPIGNYSAGTYLLQVRTRSNIYLRKVIVN